MLAGVDDVWRTPRSASAFSTGASFMKLGRAPTTWRMCFTTDPRILWCGRARDQREPANAFDATTRSLGLAGAGPGSVSGRCCGCGRMQRHGTEQREQHGVSRHLQAELDALLQPDGDQPGDRPAAEPPGRRRQLIGAAAPVDLTDEEQQAQRHGIATQQPAFREHLQVVVVGLAEELVEIVPLVEAGRDADRC